MYCCSLEKEWLDKGTLRKLLLAHTPSQNLDLHYTQPTIGASLQAWKYFLKYGNTCKRSLQIQLPLGYIHFLLPYLSTITWEIKGIKGITKLTDPVQYDRPIPFKKLQSAYALPDRDFLRHTQIVSYLRHHPTTELYDSLAILDLT